MTIIRAASYSDTERKLTDDPIVQGLAAGVASVSRDELAHEGGTPRHTFMGAANEEYAHRGGEIQGHIGAVAAAILTLLDEEPMHFYLVEPENGWITNLKCRRYELRPGVTVTVNTSAGAVDWKVIKVDPAPTSWSLDGEPMGKVHVLPADEETK